MNKNRVLEKVDARIVLRTIFDYIKDDNLKFKLFTYSKFFQKKLGINLNDYKEKFIESKIKFDNFLTYSYNSEITKYLNEFLFKNSIDINFFQKTAVRYFEKYLKNNNNKNNGIEFTLDIDIYSPFFDSISKSVIFDQFTTIISKSEIEKNNLKNDYISVFNKLNKSKYSSLKLLFQNDYDINYLKDFKINLGQIKRLELYLNYNVFVYSNNYLFETLFSSNNFGKNLIYLKIDIVNNRFNNAGYITESYLFNNLNNFKLLKCLQLIGIKFHNCFNLNLNNLEYLNIRFCSNIIFNVNSNLKSLNYWKNSLVITKNKLKLPELEKCIINEEFSSIVDFSSLNKLKELTCETKDFLLLKDLLLEKIELYSSETKENEIKMIEKILSIKTLKKVKFELNQININDILKIENENSSITDLEITSNKNLILYNIEDKFPNISRLLLYTNNIFNNGVILDIKPNSKSKINSFSLTLNGIGNIKFYIQSYEKLEKIELNIANEIINLKNIMPIFDNNSKIIFNSLVHFDLSYSQNMINFDILDNVYNNIDKMPNLKYFSLACISKDINISFHNNFIRKLLSRKLDYVKLVIEINEKQNGELYSLNELKEIYPEITNIINNITLNKIIIRKL